MSAIPSEVVRFGTVFAAGALLTIIVTVARIVAHRRGVRGGRRRW